MIIEKIEDFEGTEDLPWDANVANVKSYIAVDTTVKGKEPKKVLIRRYVLARTREQESNLPQGIPRGLFAPIINEINIVRLLTNHQKHLKT